MFIPGQTDREPKGGNNLTGYMPTLATAILKLQTKVFKGRLGTLTLLNRLKHDRNLKLGMGELRGISEFSSPIRALSFEAGRQARMCTMLLCCILFCKLLAQDISKYLFVRLPTVQNASLSHRASSQTGRGLFPAPVQLTWPPTPPPPPPPMPSPASAAPFRAQRHQSPHRARNLQRRVPAQENSVVRDLRVGTKQYVKVMNLRKPKTVVV